MTNEKQAEQPKVSLHEALDRFLAQGEYKQHTAKHGKERYKFSGMWLAGTTGQWVAGKEQTRWTEEDLYALEGGGFLVAYVDHTMWEGEETGYGIKRFSSTEELEQGLLDELRDNLCKELKVKIPLSDIAKDISELDI